ncbi:hypothetical protein BJF93_15400 [Xaviernesmea oryzae]|uniref:Uncharacterized protein n=1 Tax=Xaviernesmea oryzae TaxID=464029 RepID=A0A1Q9AY19_9HYPH|nr:hypothetical protein [Xaviernesmea oryzae]OLP60341.1 hypothetical protein BJF93_15400 [Xaviernesmea oryzae]SEK22641.1 hypothetical protein SAMN04487976_101139 [Xaviernesmea oryzae]
MANRRGIDTKRQVKDLLQQELPMVYRIALDLVKDSRVPPSARAKLISDIFRAGGLFIDAGDDRPKEPYEMSAEEIQAELTRLQSRRGQNSAEIFD